MSELYSLPNGWEWKKLGKIAKLQNGFAFKSKLFVNDGLPIVRIKNIKNEKVLLDDVVYFNVEDYGKKLDSYQIKKNDILIAMSGATTGKIGLYDTEEISYLNQRVGLFRIENSNLRSYLFYFLSTQIEKNLELSLGAAQPNLSTEQINNIELPLPPLEEQKRIVAKLDILFAKIDKAIALHQKNIDEADIFMASVLNDVFVELEEKYGLDNIGNMIDILTDYHSNGAYKNLKENVELLDKEDYALMIRATDLENEDYSKNVKYITESAYNYMSKSKVFGGEIILPKIGTIGNVYFMPYLKRPVSLAMNLFMLRCSDKVLNKYMFLFLKSSKGNEDILNSPNCYEQSQSRTRGVANRNLVLNDIKQIFFPLPPLKTQQKVVAYLDEISQKMEKIKQIQKEKMQSLKALKASILDQAFKGEL